MCHEIDRLKFLARQEIDRLESRSSLFISGEDELIDKVFSSLSNSSIRTVGPELIFGRIYDYIGFGRIKEELFRHLVISRLKDDHETANELLELMKQHLRNMYADMKTPIVRKYVPVQYQGLVLEFAKLIEEGMK